MVVVVSRQVLRCLASSLAVVMPFAAFALPTASSQAASQTPTVQTPPAVVQAVGSAATPLLASPLDPQWSSSLVRMRRLRKGPNTDGETRVLETFEPRSTLHMNESALWRDTASLNAFWNLVATSARALDIPETVVDQAQNTRADIGLTLERGTGNAVVHFAPDQDGEPAYGVSIDHAFLQPLLSTRGVMLTEVARRVPKSALPRWQKKPVQGGQSGRYEGWSGVDCTVKKCVSLTFDDGPGPETTPRLLDMLREHDVLATFFVLGQNTSAFPKVAQRIVDDGHEIANHSYSHPLLTRLGASQVAWQMRTSADAIEAATGVRPKMMRPPYGGHNASVDRIVGGPIMLWDVDTLDWKYKVPSRVAHVALSESSAGSIVLMHDIHPTTVAAVPQIIKGLRDKGFTLVPLSDLYGDSPPQDGVTYVTGPPESRH